MPMAAELLQGGVNFAAARAATRGRTALETAAEYGRLDIDLLLLNACANSNAIST